MWRMSSGDRVLTEAEWALFRVGLDLLWDYIEDDDDDSPGLSATGVRVFDALSSEQKLTLLADVTQALRDPAIPTPRHTAANEGAIAAVFATIRNTLEEELAFSHDETDASTEIRSLLLAVTADAEEQPEDLPDLMEADPEPWEWLLEAVEERIFWDADYEMGDAFLDRPPEEGHELLEQMRIDEDYYTAIPREPSAAGMITVRQRLARLTGRPAPDDDGLYPALEDNFHNLIVGPCSQEEIDAWADHPWIAEIGMSEPVWDCDYATWVAKFRDAMPTDPFKLPTGRETALPVSGELPDDVRAEQHGDAWVIRNVRGEFWCDALTNCWDQQPEREIPALTFASQQEAEAAYREADRMYGERASRHQAAMASLGHPDDA
jgi:hypothetical protein